MTAAVLVSCLLASAPITGCPDFEIEAPRPAADAPVVRAVDYGLSESGDKNAAAINRALAAAKRLKASRVELAPGTYRCLDEPGVTIEGFRDFAFDGKGATLVFRRSSRNSEKKFELVHGSANVNVTGCTRVEVGNFNLDWDWAHDPLGFWCRAVAKHENARDNESYFDLELEKPHPRYPEDVPVQMMTQMADAHFGARPDTTRGSRYYFGGNPGHWGSKSRWLSPTRLRVWPYVAAKGHFIARDQAGRFSPQANRSGVRRCDTNLLYHVVHYYYGLNGINLHGNAHLTLRNVEIWACRGMGVQTTGPQHHWQLVNVNIRPKPGSDYPITATADAHHVAQMRGYLKMIDCDTSMHQDDHFNLHDRTQIGWAIGADRVEIVNNRGVEFACFEPGMEIELRQDDYAKTGWTGRIAAIDGEIVRFDRPLPRQTGKFFVLFNRTYGVEKVLFRNCRFHDAPWSRGLMMGYDITFDGCTFGPMVGSPLRFQSCYTYNVWCEGIGCRNVVVRNCRFENCLDVYTLNGASGTVFTMFTGVRMPWKNDAPQLHTLIRHEGLRKAVADYEAKGVRLEPSPDALGDILVEDCTFVNPRGYLWYVMNGDNLVFRNNRVVRDGNVRDPLPYAGRLLVTGGTNVDFPLELTDRKDR